MKVNNEMLQGFNNLYNEGHTLRYIADVYNLSTATISNYIWNKRENKELNKVDEEMIKNINVTYNRGFSMVEVANMLHVRISSVVSNVECARKQGVKMVRI